MFIFEEVARPEVIRRERIRNRIILGVVIAAILGGVLYFIFQNYFEEREVKRFVAALEQSDYQSAYRIWKANPSYTFEKFMRDWGPHGDYGKVNSYKFVRSRSVSNGVVITSQINGREAALWVDRETKAITFAPEQTIVITPPQ